MNQYKKKFTPPFEIWPRSQNQTSDSQFSLQSHPRPHDYTYRSVRAHIPVPARNVRAYILVPATAIRAHIPACAIGVLPTRTCLPVVAYRVRARHPVRAIAPACATTWQSRW
jgi:hypothetical protein